jgi:hypothetical protein
MVADGFDCLVPSPLVYATGEMSSSSLICPWKFGMMFLNVRSELCATGQRGIRWPLESALHNHSDAIADLRVAGRVVNVVALSPAFQHLFF